MNNITAIEKEQLIKEYVVKNKPLFSINKIDSIRDGGTIVLDLQTPSLVKKPFYIHKDNWTLHSDYPTTDENLISDRPTHIYIMDRLDKYKRDIEFDLNQVKNIIDKIKS